MTVKAILKSKGSAVLTSKGHTTLSDAARMMSERRIGSLLITDDHGAIAGILSERDIVRAVAKLGERALNSAIADAMTRDVMTCVEDEPINEIMSRMTSGKFRHLPVVADGKLIGIISIGDVVKSRVEEMETETQAMRDYIRTA